MNRKNLDKQHHGGIDGILGSHYEAVFFVRKLVEMLISYGTKIIRVRRQKSKSKVDDIYYEETDHLEYFCQCKKYAEYNRDLFIDFLEQYQQNLEYQLKIVTQQKDRVLDVLLQDARKYKYREFIERLEEDSQLKKQKDKFNIICSFIPSDERNQSIDKEYFIYKFLNSFFIELFNDFEPDKEIKDLLVLYGYSVGDADKIYDRLVAKSSDYKWLNKDIDNRILRQELEDINVKYLTKEISLFPINTPETKEDNQIINVIHILQNPKARFVEKLSYIFDFISSLKKPRFHERKQTLEIIKNDNMISWHFLRNLKDSDWFPEIIDTVIKSITSDKVDSAVKDQLLKYFEICAEKYSDEIIPLIVELENNTKNPNMLASLVRTIIKLEPSRKENLDQIWVLLEKLSEHQHPWVRKEIPDVLRMFAECDFDRSLKILESIFFYAPAPTDVVFGSSIAHFSSQGKHNEDLVFNQGVKTLSELMTYSISALKAFALAIKLETQFIRQERSGPVIVAGIALDYSHIWFANQDANRDTEYVYDKRVRLALEIEKRLDEIAVSNSELAIELFDLLVNMRCEVIYLIVIKVLTRHFNGYQDLAKQVIFNKNLWEIYGIRSHFLQLLIQEYFKQHQDRLSEYIEAVKSYKSDSDNPDTTEFIKQDLLAAIPENLRTIDIEQELSRLEISLNSPARIGEPFSVYSGVYHPEPDIKLSELKAKSVDELVKIMEDYTNINKQREMRDLSPVFSELINENPSQLMILLEKMVDKEIDQWFSGDMLRAYINSQETTLPDVLNIFWKLREVDRWAKLEVARYLNQECRKKEISKIDENVLEELKRVVFSLASDQDPKYNQATESSDTRPTDALTRGINSIRGISAEILTALVFFFPKNKDIRKKLIELSDDKTNAVKSTIIYNLRYLIRKDYDLCKFIANKFQDDRKPGIDSMLVSYFSQLDRGKFEANKGFIKLLFNDSNGEVQEDLGKLIGYRYIDGFDVEDLVKSVIKQQKGNIATRLALAFVFESTLVERIAMGKYQRIIPYFKDLLDPNIEFDREVKERATFVFERDELKTDFFMILDAEGIFDVVSRDSSSIIVQDHLIHYLHKCVLGDESIGRCMEIIHSQVINVPGIIEEPLIVRKLAEILRKVFSVNDLDAETKELAEQIFDKGLEKGWDEFYKIFHERFGI